MRLRIASISFVVAVAISAATMVRVSAWGAQGHQVIARIAWALMTPEARDRSAALLGGDMDAFVAASTWADAVRSTRPETANWHFVNIPVGGTRYNAARDCRASAGGDCVIAEIARARTELVNGRSNTGRAEALKFLIHFVGDLHQPLHSIDNHDRGGNDVPVAPLRGGGGRATNLHAVWDTGLINLSAETEVARAERLLIDLASHAAPPGLDVVKWAEDSHEVAVRVVYRYAGFSPNGPPTAAVTLDDAYRRAAMPAIDRQLQLGGARLAALLNSLL